MKKNIQLPDYNRSILSVSSSIMKYYHLNSKYKSLSELDYILNNNYNVIIFLILDCVGTNIIENNLGKDSFLRKNLLTNVTTVFPPSTAAATTAFHSCLSPLESGWIGWMPYFKEHNCALTLFTGCDYYTGEKVIDDYKKYGLDYETIYEKICRKNKDVNYHKCFPKFDINGSKTFEELCDKIKNICKSNTKNIISAYWDETDSIIHENGTVSKLVKYSLQNIDKSLKELSQSLEDALIIISADHGAIDLKEVFIDEIDEINECLLLPPTIEARFVSFFIKKGKKLKFKKALKKYFKDKYIIYTKEKFLKTGLLGTGVQHKKINDYLGDYIVIMSSDLSIRYHGYKKKKTHVADHSGITKEEMIVPVIAINTNSVK